MKKAIVAFVSVLVSVVILSTASYAWFAVNSSVTVDAISVSVKASDGILIAYDENAAPTDIDVYRNSASAVTATLLPASSADAVSFWRPVSVDGDGSRTSLDYLPALNPSDPSGAKYYVDIPLYLISIKPDGDLNIWIDTSMTGITKVGSDVIYKAVRVAVFNVGADGTAPSVANRVLAFKSQDYTGLFDNKVPSGANTDTDEWVTTLSNAVTSADGDFVLARTGTGTVDPDGIRAVPLKIIVRVWIDGENVNCVAANAGDSFSVSISFTMDDPTP